VAAAVLERSRPTVLLVTHDVDEALALDDRVHGHGRPTGLDPGGVPPRPAPPEKARRPELAGMKESLLRCLENVEDSWNRAEQ
jgi:ABC-type nitrate/sulfonate/bicarbonate transport system ATPase subunit